MARCGRYGSYSDSGDGTALIEELNYLLNALGDDSTSIRSQSRVLRQLVRSSSQAYVAIYAMVSDTCFHFACVLI